MSSHNDSSDDDYEPPCTGEGFDIDSPITPLSLQIPASDPKVDALLKLRSENLCKYEEIETELKRSGDMEAYKKNIWEARLQMIDSALSLMETTSNPVKFTLQPVQKNQ